MRQDLGHGVSVRPFTAWPDEPGVHGLIVEHTHDDGTVCRASLYYDSPALRRQWPNYRGGRWQVISATPLTLHPSVKNPTCGLHGWIRGGRWHPV